MNKDVHPEAFCSECGSSNPTWYADNVLWNSLVGDRYSIICPCCFQARADKLGKNIIFKAIELDPTID